MAMMGRNGIVVVFIACAIGAAAGWFAERAWEGAAGRGLPALPDGQCDDGRARSPVSPERSEPRKRWLQGCAPQSAIQSADDQAWRETLVEIALRQLMNDESIQSRTRQVFLRVVVNGENPEDVAAAFGITCNGVYLIKNRMMPRLQKIVVALEKAGNI